MSMVSTRSLIRRAVLGVGAAVSLTLPAVAIADPSIVAHAAGSSPIPAIRQALKGVTSYRVDGSLIGTGNAVTKLSIISVHRGNVAQLQATITAPNSSGNPAYSDIVIVGSRVCARQSARAHYSCTVNATQALSVEKSLNLLALFNTSSVNTDTYVPTAPKTIEGQVCNGYTVVSRSTRKSTGALYVARGSNLPYQIVGKSSTSSSGFNNGVITFSRYNDPALTVPTIK